MLELGRLVNHHRLLTVDHLRAHRVEEVGSLLQGQTLFVELLSVLRDLMALLWHLEAILAEHTRIFNQRNELL